MTTVLFLLLALALAIIGVLIQAGGALGSAFLGGLSGMTKRMGPGVTYEEPRSTLLHWFFYAGALGSLAGAIWSILS